MWNQRRWWHEAAPGCRGGTNADGGMSPRRAVEVEPTPIASGTVQTRERCGVERFRRGRARLQASERLQGGALRLESKDKARLGAPNAGPSGWQSLPSHDSARGAACARGDSCEGFRRRLGAAGGCGLRTVANVAAEPRMRGRETVRPWLQDRALAASEPCSRGELWRQNRASHSDFACSWPPPVMASCGPRSK